MPIYNLDELKKKKNKASKMDVIIPDDIIAGILVRLPAKSVFKLRCVCKYWFNLISDPVFIKLHLHHHQHVDQTNHSILFFDYSPYDSLTLLRSLNYYNNSIDDEAPKLVYTSNSTNWKLFPPKLHNYMPLGSCNGLLCILTSKSILSSGDRIHLLNPCTKKYRELPQVDHEQVVVPSTMIKKKKKVIVPAATYYSDQFTYGFGYDRINDDYKVVKNFSHYNIIEGRYQCRTVVDVYTLGTNTWRRIEDVLPYKLKDVGVLVGGVLYWRVQTTMHFYIIVGFELGDEVHKEIFPPSPSWWDPCEHMLELNGCLSIFQRNTKHDTIEVWSLMNKDNSDDWAHLFTIAEPKLVMPYFYEDCIPLGASNEDGELLMKLTKNKELVWYNPRDGKTRFFAEIPYRSHRSVVKYTESLVSLNLGGNHGEITESLVSLNLGGNHGEII